MSSSAAADIANVVEGISWNTCFNHLHWYRKDIHFPLRVSQSVRGCVHVQDKEECKVPVTFPREDSAECGDESSVLSGRGCRACSAMMAPLYIPENVRPSDKPSAVGYGAMPGPFSLSGHYSRGRQVQDPENMHTSSESSSSDWYEERMARAFSGVSVSEVAWLMTYVSKASAYMRADIWMCQNGSMEQRMRRMIDGNVTAHPNGCYQYREHDAAARGPNTSGMARALRSVVHSSEDLRQMSDAARFVSCAVKNRNMLWENAGMQSNMSPLYAHLSCRMLELAALMDEKDALSTVTNEEQEASAGDSRISSRTDRQHASLDGPCCGIRIKKPHERHVSRPHTQQAVSFPSPSYYLSKSLPSAYHPCLRSGTSGKEDGLFSLQSNEATFEYARPEN